MVDNPRIEELRRRVQADPASIAFASLAEEYRRAGRFDEAIQTCRDGLQRHPSYLSARVTLGRALIQTGDFENARQELEIVLKAAPENLAAIRGLAEIHERLARVPELMPAASIPVASAAAPDIPDWALSAAQPAQASGAEQHVAPAHVTAPPEDDLLNRLEKFLAAVRAARQSATQRTRNASGR